MNSLLTLQRYFGYSSFRKGQEEIIDTIMNSKQVIAVLPTGAGKSICYQIPGLMAKNFSIVISPLIALMKDQVDSLNKQEEIAAFINSTMNFYETEEVLNKIAFGKIKLLYLAPEKLESLKFADRIKQLNPSHLFIDEAHCISEWGHNFRPSYLKIKEFIEHTSIKKIAAFTATATPEVVDDILVQLELKSPKIFVRGFERDNLQLNVISTKNKKKKCAELIREISGSAIIYTSSRKHAEDIAEYLTLSGFNCPYYHAGMPAPERRRIQEEFISGDIDIIAATNAFGMGIDKKDIRIVIHYNVPGSIESYYQEIGRAGRDDEESFCYLFYNDKDLAIQNYFISNSHPNKELIQQIYKAVCDYNRVAIGSLPEKELIIEPEYITNYTGVKITKGLLETALKYLENAGFIARISGYEKKDSVQILAGKDKLKQFVTNTTNEELKNSILLLLKEFGNKIFIDPVKISVENLANTLGIPLNELTDSLTVLDNLGIISFTPAIRRPTIKLITTRVPTEQLNFNYKLINESYLRSKRKLNKITEFAFTQDCRFKFILNYFGEELDNYRCGKCDNCLTTDKLSKATSEFIADAVLNTLEESNSELSEKVLLQILTGKSIKNSFSLFGTFGACKKHNDTEIRMVIQELVTKGNVIKTYGSVSYLTLNKKPEEKKSRRKRDDKPVEINYNQNLYLFNLLREARKKAAERFVQSEYLICPDNLLREIANTKPKTKNELLGIRGFNTRMLNKIGNEFLAVINTYSEEGKLIDSEKKESNLPKNILETQKLLNKKYTLKEIAETLRLSEAVISMQIETIIEYDSNTDVSHLYNKDIFHLIISEIKKGYDNLKDLKERLPSKVTYPQIRIAAAKYKFNSLTQI